MAKVRDRMQIETKYQGTMHIQKEQVITFEKGLPAFEEEKRFVILPFEEETPFFVLQSIERAEVAFIIVDPFSFVAQYEVKLPDNVIAQLSIQKEEDIAIFVILTVQEPFTKTTANLQAPIVINTVKQKGQQFLMSTSGYKTKHAIFAVAKEAK